MKILALLGFVILLGSLPIAGLAFILSCFWLFVVATIIGITGALALSVGILLKLGSLLFRA